MSRYGTLSVIALLFTLIFSFPNMSFSAPQRRIALVIGNGKYRIVPLRNPLNDAEDIIKALKKYGFEVTYKENVEQREMEAAIWEFGRTLQKGDVGLFYFAGHGVQIDGRNYLIPIDATIHGKADVKYEAVDAGRVLDAMEWAANEFNIVILDACRDNPYGSSFRSITRGLARMDAPKGTIIAYSTSPGKVALDGKKRNSPYTKALLKYMDFQSLTLEQVFKKVRKDIDFDTNGKQIPWEATSLTGTFYFRGIKTKKEPKEIKKQPVPKPRRTIVARKSSSVKRAPSYLKYFGKLARSELPEATLYFKEVLKKRPEDNNARSGMAIGAVFLGDEEDMAYHLKRLKESNISSTNVRIAVGFMEGLQGLYLEGFYELKRALEEGGDKALIKLCTVAVAERNGDRQQARKALEEYRDLVPNYKRNAFYVQLSDRLETLNKLLGAYYITHREERTAFAFGIKFSMIKGALTASLTQSKNSSYYDLQNVSFENGKLVFRVKEEVNRLWTINEYEAEPKENFNTIPVEVRQIEGNCGKTGALFQVFMLRASESVLQNRSLKLYPSGFPLAHSQGCFVATAAFGSPFAKNVNILRNFRDRFMLSNSVGKSLVYLYYRYGPALAKTIEDHPWARAGARIALAPFVVFAGVALGNPRDYVVLIAFLLSIVAFCWFQKGRKSRSQSTE